MPKPKPLESLQEVCSALGAFEHLDDSAITGHLQYETERLVLFFARRIIESDRYVCQAPAYPNPSLPNTVDIDTLILRFAKAAILRMVNQSPPQLGLIDTDRLTVLEPNKALGWKRKSRTPPKRDPIRTEVLAILVAIHVETLERRGLNHVEAVQQAGRDFPGPRSLPRNGVEGDDIDRSSWVYSQLHAVKGLKATIAEWSNERLNAEAAAIRWYLGYHDREPAGES